jgi:hypothetical protein
MDEQDEIISSNHNSHIPSHMDIGFVYLQGNGRNQLSYWACNNILSAGYYKKKKS